MSITTVHNHISDTVLTFLYQFMYMLTNNFNYLYVFHHHHMSIMESGHLLTHSSLTYLEASSEVCHDSFCQLGNSVLLSWAVCHEAFCLHVVSSSSCIPVVYLEPVLFLIPFQCVNLFCNLSKCILLFILLKTIYVHLLVCYLNKEIQYLETTITYWFCSNEGKNRVVLSPYTNQLR